MFNQFYRCVNLLEIDDSIVSINKFLQAEIYFDMWHFCLHC